MQNEPGCPTDQQCVPRPTGHGVIIALKRPILCRPLRWPRPLRRPGPGGHLTLGGDAGDLLDDQPITSMPAPSRSDCCRTRLSGSCQSRERLPRARGLQGMTPTPRSAHSGSISCSSSRLSRLQWFCMETNGMRSPWAKAQLGSYQRWSFLALDGQALHEWTAASVCGFMHRRTCWRGRGCLRRRSPNRLRPSGPSSGLARAHSGVG
jgi:hypothetical protein